LLDLEAQRERDSFRTRLLLRRPPRPTEVTPQANDLEGRLEYELLLEHAAREPSLKRHDGTRATGAA
jgi:hypothetical protein